MEPNSTFSRNQELFLNALLLGESIIDAASHASVSKSTAFRWLRDPVFQAERKRRETVVSETEQEQINKILTSGYALIHKRVEALDTLAALLQEEVFDESKRWLLDVKTVGFGENAERVDLKQFNGDLIKEYRATFDDLAKELGQRVKKQEIEHSGLVELLNAEHASLLADLESLPDGTVENTTENSDAGEDTV